ncbi:MULTISPECIES: hypothetical protein [Alteromonas]|uniref:hypothetical protein n=1 Tax=Alteromonas TaxID=226 RepID=UPI0012743107|nr:hypothetical protein [Alteromonas macleodii]CAI3932418.1 hypothetical protein EZ55_00578 [Alteromonas macleodii]VTP52361.1 hypothetical protein EZ55_00578 [Alteromonas macleodii]
MNSNFSYLLSSLKADFHNEFGPFIELLDFEHRDYIEDVLAEIFDIEYEFSQELENESFILYFCNRISFESLTLVIKQINVFHKEQGRLYELPSET